jgi:hypothetical protein
MQKENQPASVCFAKIPKIILLKKSSTKAGGTNNKTTVRVSKRLRAFFV